MSNKSGTQREVVLDVPPGGTAPSGRMTLVIFVPDLDEWAAHAVALQSTMAADRTLAVSLARDETDRRRLLDGWAATHADIPLAVLDDDIRSLSRHFAQYLRALEPGPDNQIVVLIPRPAANYLGSARKRAQTAAHLRSAVWHVPWTVALQGAVPWTPKPRVRPHASLDPAGQSSTSL
jgi:hypothetical protein